MLSSVSFDVSLTCLNKTAAETIDRQPLQVVARVTFTHHHVSVNMIVVFVEASVVPIVGTQDMIG